MSAKIPIDQITIGIVTGRIDATNLDTGVEFTGIDPKVVDVLKDLSKTLIRYQSMTDAYDVAKTLHTELGVFVGGFDLAATAPSEVLVPIAKFATNFDAAKRVDLTSFTADMKKVEKVYVDTGAALTTFDASAENVAAVDAFIAANRAALGSIKVSTPAADIKADAEMATTVLYATELAKIKDLATADTAIAMMCGHALVTAPAPLAAAAPAIVTSSTKELDLTSMKRSTRIFAIMSAANVEYDDAVPLSEESGWATLKGKLGTGWNVK